jgi:hypothetical protein
METLPEYTPEGLKIIAPGATTLSPLKVKGVEVGNLAKSPRLALKTLTVAASYALCQAFI